MKSKGQEWGFTKNWASRVKKERIGEPRKAGEGRRILKEIVNKEK